MTSRPTFAPLVLRLALGATFLWAGLGKVFTEIEVSGERAAALRAMGVGGASAVPTDAAGTGGGAGGAGEAADPSRPVPTEPLPSPKTPGSSVAPMAPGKDPGKDSGKDPGTTTADRAGRVRLAAWSAQEPSTEPMRVERLYGLALLVRGAANPAPNADGTTPMALWPVQLATDRLPVYFAWAAAVSEIVAGTLCVLGFFTRLSAFTLAGIMAVAIWLTEIGPAMQSGNTVLGFLPVRETYTVALSPGGYVTLLWQAALLSMSLALLTLGGGRASLDGALFGGGSPKPAPKPAPPKPAA